jgi:gliding motility-associated-like protein
VKTLLFITMPVNDAPILEDIRFSTEEDTPVSGQVFTLADRDPEGTALIVVTTPDSQPVNGSIAINTDGTFTYTPAVGYNGADSARVRISDSGIPLPGASSLKTIRFNVTPVNITPTILVNGAPGTTMRVSTPEDTPIVFCFEAVDPDRDDVSLDAITNISGGGTLELYNQIEFCFIYTPPPGYHGTSTWDIQVCDNGTPRLCGKALAIIDVTPVNDTPVAKNDTITVLRNVAKEGNLLLNDTDPEGDGLILQPELQTPPLHGTAVLNVDGSFSYVSDISYRGLDSLVYVVCDTGSPSACTTGTLYIQVDDLPLKVYQGVSPNGDGNNEFLRIDGVDFYSDSYLRIFDRFNNLVFEMRQYDNNERVWRGEANQGMARGTLPDGTYFYLLDVGDPAIAPMSGFVVLKKE